MQRRTPSPSRRQILRVGARTVPREYRRGMLQSAKGKEALEMVMDPRCLELMQGLTGLNSGDSAYFLLRTSQFVSAGSAIDISVVDLLDNSPNHTLSYNDSSAVVIRAINSFRWKISDLLQDPRLTRVMNMGLTIDDVRLTLSQRGLSEQDGNSAGTYFEYLYNMAISPVQEVQAYRDVHLRRLRDFAQAVGDIYQYDPNAQARLVSKLRRYDFGLEKHQRTLEGSLEGESKFRRLVKSALEKYAGKALDEYFQRYLALAKAGIFSIIADTEDSIEEKTIDGLLGSLWILAGGDGKYKKDSLESLAAKDKELGEIRGLLQTTSEKKEDLFYLLLENPEEHMQLARTMSKIGVRLRDYTSFLLDRASAPINEQGETALDFIKGLVSQGKTEVVRLLFRTNADWIPAADRIYSIAQSPNSELLVGSYLEHMGRGEAYEGIILGLSRVNIAPEELKRVLNRLNYIPDSELEALPKEWDLNMLYAALFPAQPKKDILKDISEKSRGHIPPPGTAGYSLDQICRIPGVNAARVTEADLYLQVLDLGGVWQQLEVSDPERINRLAGAIIASPDSKHLPLVLENPILLSNYFALLDSKPRNLDSLLLTVDPGDKAYAPKAIQILRS